MRLPRIVVPLESRTSTPVGPILRVARHAVGSRADVVALDDRAIGVDDADLFADGVAFFSVVAGAGNDIALGGGRSADAVVARESLRTAVAPITVTPTSQSVADHDVALSGAGDTQSGEGVALSRRCPAHDVARRGGPTHVALDNRREDR